MSESFTYTCEVCGGEVTMSNVEYNRLKFGKWGARVVCDGCQDAPVLKEAHASKVKKRPDYRPRSMPPAGKGLNLSIVERDEYGVTVTIREVETRKLATLVGNGPVVPALRGVCAEIDARPGEWRVVTVSTPATIFGDLQGARDTYTRSPELTLLSKVGRSDLAERRAS